MVGTPNQGNISQEDLKNLSPEEILELQRKNCIFCKIIKGEVNSRKIYEDDKVVAILDINPANPGHTLLLPKEHYMILPQIPEDVLKHLFIVAKALSQVLLKAVGATGTNIFVANGAAAGQRAPHFMIHVIPRIEGDGISVFNLPGNKVDERVLLELRTSLSKLLDQVLNPKKEKEEVVIERPKEVLKSSEGKAGSDEEKSKEGNEDKTREKIRKEAGEEVGKKKGSSLDDITKLLLGK